MNQKQTLQNQLPHGYNQKNENDEEDALSLTARQKNIESRLTNDNQQHEVQINQKGQHEISLGGTPKEQKKTKSHH